MMKQYERKAIFTELKPYDIFAKEHDFMEVCEWNNGEGFDVTKNEQQFSLTWGQWECLQALVAFKG